MVFIKVLNSWPCTTICIPTLPEHTTRFSFNTRAGNEPDLVTNEQKGRTLLFRASISHPIVREAKIFATLPELSPLIAAEQNGIVRMILFGSCAV